MSGAGTRVHKLGTVYSRVRDLIRSGAMRHEDRPIWFDVYERFPPKNEPVYKAETEVDVETGLVHVEDNVPTILYREDWARQQFRRLNKGFDKKAVKSPLKSLQMLVEEFKYVAEMKPELPNELIYIEAEKRTEERKEAEKRHKEREEAEKRHEEREEAEKRHEEREEAEKRHEEREEAEKRHEEREEKLKNAETKNNEQEQQNQINNIDE